MSDTIKRIRPEECEQTAETAAGAAGGAGDGAAAEAGDGAAGGAAAEAGDGAAVEAADGAAAYALAVCHAVERPLTALSDLIQATAARRHQSRELRAVLERVGRQAAAVQALVEATLATELAPELAAGSATVLAPEPAREPAPVRVTQHARVPDAGDPSVIEVLTTREKEVLVLVADGVAGKEIAHRLGITSATVRSHVQNILTKLGVCSRRQAAALLSGRLTPPVRARLRGTSCAADPARGQPSRRLPGSMPRASPSAAQVSASAACASGGALPALPAASAESAASATPALARLTRRELQVLRCLAAGLGRTEIAERLYVSPHTVRTHIQRVLAKLGVHSALGAMAVARNAGLAPAG
jgi:DNA-binding NarL/FixJ family response regulator